ncbi:SH3 domain-containing protein [Saccharopolyspora griseoalba]|uniref:SH3 domain-containing protein n=1 Tax=Saccharopolyspora griseoalba TaxID=1431848 RepID=A0ABW2LL51_9PSEU
MLLAGAGLIGAVYLIGNDQEGSGSAAPDCSFEVTADVLNVRSGPSESATRIGGLGHREEVEATPNVVEGFRELDPGSWAAAEFLAPVPGSDCAP